MEEWIAGFGEVMLRLAPAGKTRLAQALPGTLEATFGGGEANVCASLAMLGEKSRYLTALPENPVSGGDWGWTSAGFCTGRTDAWESIMRNTARHSADQMWCTTGSIP